jgi:hypothetical protein
LANKKPNKKALLKPLIPNNFVFVSTQLPPTLLLSFRNFGVASFYLINFGLANFVSKKVPFLNYKVAATPYFGAVVDFHGWFSKTPVSVSKPVWSLVS